MKSEEKITLADGFPGKLAQPARRALVTAGIRNIAQLTGIREAEILRLHGIGPKAAGQLTLALAEAGLAFAPDHKEESA